MKHYPILFTFRDKVLGNGFLADVTVHGRALAAEEEDGWWMYGVQPGDIAAGGSTFAEAAAEFHKTYTAVLFDIAEDAKDHKVFKAEVDRFFKEINGPTEDEWATAVTEVRAGRITAEAVSEGFPKQSADSPRFVDIRVLTAFKPKDNILDPALDSQMAVAA